MVFFWSLFLFLNKFLFAFLDFLVCFLGLCGVFFGDFLDFKVVW